MRVDAQRSGEQEEGQHALEDKVLELNLPHQIHGCPGERHPQFDQQQQEQAEGQAADSHTDGGRQFQEAVVEEGQPPGDYDQQGRKVEQ